MATHAKVKKEFINPPKPKEVEEFDAVCEKLRSKKKELEEVWRDIEGLTDEIVDQEGEKKKALVIQRSECIQEAELLQAELKVLNERKKVAYLKIYTKALEVAKSELGLIIEERRKINENNWQWERKKRDEMRNDMSTVEDRGEREDKVVAVEMELAESHARALVNQNSLQRIKNTIRRCEMELEKAQEVIAGW